MKTRKTKEEKRRLKEEKEKLKEERVVEKIKSKYTPEEWQELEDIEEILKASVEKTKAVTPNWEKIMADIEEVEQTKSFQRTQRRIERANERKRKRQEKKELKRNKKLSK